MPRSILSLTDFKAGARELLDELEASGSSLVLTQNGRARAVVEDYARHEAREQALVMLKLMVQGEADATEGRLEDQSRLFASLRREFTDTGADD
ncbi:MAG: type II toxin-antitoxin system Phd/YefM family antitoxin [Pseudomonadales bacterium]|jgi:hypothetical protein|nr:type II toxin-antitoxin system Phd/YefM family antitoxin [Pseudomonadales bacterium]